MSGQTYVRTNICLDKHFMQALKIISFSIFHQINFKMVLFSASCHEDSIRILGYKIEAWEGGQKIGQTDRQAKL